MPSVPAKSSNSEKASVENCSLSATLLRLAISFYVLQDHRGSFSAVGLLRLVLRSDRHTNEPKTRKEPRTKPTKRARKKSTLRMTRTTTDKLLVVPTCDFYYKLARRLPAPSPGPALLSAAAGASVYLEPVHP